MPYLGISRDQFRPYHYGMDKWELAGNNNRFRAVEGAGHSHPHRKGRQDPPVAERLVRHVTGWEKELTVAPGPLPIRRHFCKPIVLICGGILQPRQVSEQDSLIFGRQLSRIKFL